MTEHPPFPERLKGNALLLVEIQNLQDHLGGRILRVCKDNHIRYLAQLLCFYVGDHRKEKNVKRFAFNSLADTSIKRLRDFLNANGLDFDMLDGRFFEPFYFDTDIRRIAEIGPEVAVPVLPAPPKKIAVGGNIQVPVSSKLASFLQGNPELIGNLISAFNSAAQREFGEAIATAIIAQAIENSGDLKDVKPRVLLAFEEIKVPKHSEFLRVKPQASPLAEFAIASGAVSMEDIQQCLCELIEDLEARLV